MDATISHRDLDIWANYLLDYSLDGIEPDDVVMIKGERVAWPLISVLQDKVFAAGAAADVCLVPPDNDRGKVWGASIARHGSVEQILSKVPDWHRARYDAMNKYVEVLGAESPGLFADLPEATAQALNRADEPFKRARLLKKWVLTLYPTQAFADLEGMDLDEYTGVIVAASTVDPRGLDAVEQPVHDAMHAARTFRIVTERPDGKRLELSMGIGGRKIVKCTGKRNFPDGEVFTSPDARTPEGEIFVDMPVFQGGSLIQGVYLRFEGGVIREYSAEQGHDALAKIIETDAGSHRLGEVALGMNSGIPRVLRHPLFVEKTGGTLHVAIGSSYPECYVDDPASDGGRAEVERLTAEGLVNASAQHVDIVTDFRPGHGGAGREVWLDDVRLEVRDAIWVVP